MWVRVLIITHISAPYWQQAEGQRPARNWEEAWEVIPQGKVRRHHLHAEQDSYRGEA